MATMSNLRASSSSSSSSSSVPEGASSSIPRGVYDVFLSFFGKDTRKNFTDHLYVAMKQKGINVFRDDEELKRGNNISRELSSAIEDSQYAVVVISENYAFSKWCLMELTKIVECWREKRLTILPIFYHVNPSDVRKQKGSFARAFVKHRGNPKVDEKQRTMWRAVLREVGNLAGWHVYDRYESSVVEEICVTILGGLRVNLPNIFNDLVGIESQVNEVMRLLCIEDKDVLFVGIFGMGGIGKTTLAKVIHDRVLSQFEASCFVNCFVDGISEQAKNLGIIKLQEQLIYQILKESKKIGSIYEGMAVIAKRVQHRKAIIVLDNVDTDAALKALIGSHGWFKEGSRILITSRDNHLLKSFVDTAYEVQPLNECDALKLFSLKAFKKDYPEENYVKLSKDIVDYAGGLPLALEVFGSFLFGRTIEEWKSARGYLKANPNAKILDQLKMSFDGLEDLQKELFLDIAFFFNGRKYGCQMVDILTSLGYHPNINIEVLKEKSLIKILENEEIWMHDMLVKMGHRIVHCEAPRKPNKRSRLCCYEDIINILKNNTGSIAVEGIVLNLPLQKQEQFDFKAISKMEKLRILDISYDDQNYENFHALACRECPSQFILSNDLRVLRWRGYHFDSLPSNFQPHNLVELIMPQSCIKLLWDASKCFEQLSHIDLSHSQYLIEIPDFSAAPNLTELDIYGCIHLSKVHPSVGFLKKLRRLDLHDCTSLNELPGKISLTSLQYFDASNCSKLDKFPNITDEIPEGESAMEHLEEFDITGTAIRQLPSFILFSKKLKSLDVGGSPSNPISFILPSSFSSLSSLEDLSLNYCNLSNGALPCDFDCLSSLGSLSLSGNRFTSIPQCVSLLRSLKLLDLDDCSNLQPLVEPPPTHLGCLRRQNMSFYNMLDEANLNYLPAISALDLSGIKSKRISDSISQISSLRHLRLNDCSELETLPKLPFDLLILALRNCKSLVTLGYKIDAWISSEMLVINDWSFVGIYFGYRSKPYKILHLSPQSPIWTKFDSIYIYNMVGWGPTLGTKIPMWFNQRSSSFFGMIQSRIFLDSVNELDWKGYALFIVYEVHKRGNSSSEIVSGNDPIFPRFVCRLQVNECRCKIPFLFRVPEVPQVGLNGVWVFINASCFKEVQCDFVKKKWSYIGASIGANSENVEVKECGARLVHEHELSEFSEVLSSISSHGFDRRIIDNLSSKFCVIGPIKGVGELIPEN